MRYLVAVVFLAVLTISPASEADAHDINPKKYEVLFSLSKKLVVAWKEPNLKLEEYREVLESACSVFTFLNNDKDFKDAILQHLTKSGNTKDRQAVRTIFNDFGAFADFLKVERNLLSKSGMTESAIDKFLGSMLEIRTDVLKRSSEPENFEKLLAQVAKDTCTAKDRVSEEVSSHKRVRQIGKLALFSLGLGAVAVNTSSLVVSMGISTPVAAASISLGIAAMTSYELF